MIDINIKVGLEDNSSKWTETIPAPENCKNLEKYFEQMIKDFNNEEERRHKENPEYPLGKKRKFIKIISKTNIYSYVERDSGYFSIEEPKTEGETSVV